MLLIKKTAVKPITEFTGLEPRLALQNRTGNCFAVHSFLHDYRDGNGWIE